MELITIRPDDSLLIAISSLEKCRKTIVPVTSDSGELLGVITDGDIRRGLISHNDLSSPASMVMNKNPTFFREGLSLAEIKKELIIRKIEAAPIVNSENKVIDVVYIGDEETICLNNDLSPFGAAVIMAGGEGRRLRPLTEYLPKPMLKVGGVPIIERQICSLARQGIRNIYITVNYRSDVIINYFKDGSDFGVSIRYIHEEKKLGTAGALSLLDQSYEKPLLVVNGDVITTIDYNALARFHTKNRAVLSVAAIQYHVDVPYGVVQNNGPDVVAILEKPSQKYLCNAGIYVLERKLVVAIPYNEFCNMTDLINMSLVNKEKVVVFPIHEYWTDVGSKMELEKAQEQFSVQGDYNE